MAKIIWGNCLVKNEDRYLYFSVMSVIDYIDRLIIWDTGSTDRTLEIIHYLKERFPDKILFRQYGWVNEETFTKARQEMLEETKSDWLFLLDGDEVWWNDSIKKIKQAINESGDKYNLIFNPTVNLIGDIYHYQDKSAGEYRITGKTGHFNIRAINRKIPGLHVKYPYGQEGYADKSGQMIQDVHPNKILFLDAPYLHFTHLPRSTGDDNVMHRNGKLKYELGKFMPDSYPEVLTSPTPEFVPNPWAKRSGSYLIKAAFQTPLKKLRRRLRK